MNSPILQLFQTQTSPVMRKRIGSASVVDIFLVVLVVININESKAVCIKYFQLHCRHWKYNPYSHDVQTNIALKQLANNNPHHHNQEPYYLQIRHKFHLPIFEKLWNGWYILYIIISWLHMYIVDVLWGQPIKLIQVVFTSEFHEYWWNNIVFIFLSPRFSAEPQK